MDQFSCRNCIHDPAQGLTLGRGPGFCLQWGSIVERPEQTTCKHLHRKDLPMFLVREAIEEHAEELSGAPGMVDLATHAPIAPHAYDESDRPNAERLDLTTRAVADYHALAAAPDATPSKRALLISMFAGATEARRAVVHACLVRRAMISGLPRHFWFQRALDLVQEMDRSIAVDTSDLVVSAGESEQDARAAALWETGLARLSGLQEYGEYAAIEALKYPMQELGALVADQDWAGFLQAAQGLKQGFREEIIGRDAELRARMSLKFPRVHAQAAAVGAAPGVLQAAA